MGEKVNGSYKNELIYRWSWAEVVDVEVAAFEWVLWWKESGLDQSLGYRRPTEVEAGFWTGSPRSRESRNSWRMSRNKTRGTSGEPGCTLVGQRSLRYGLRLILAI